MAHCKLMMSLSSKLLSILFIIPGSFLYVNYHLVFAGAQRIKYEGHPIKNETFLVV